MNKTKIVIAGIGGVGGYFGGLLAKHFYSSEKVEISFLARGEHLKEIQSNGLKVIKGEKEFIARPDIATDNLSDIGIADYIIISTKSYDLESVIRQLQPCINKQTIILPLLNGVDSRERIKYILPDNLVLDGCVYLVSRLKQPGVIENSGNIQSLFFGLENVQNDRLLFFETLLKEATIEATLSDTISSKIWEKYIFISPVATATSYFDNSIGEVAADTEKLNVVEALIEEVKQVAALKEVNLSEDITAKTLKILKAVPFDATTSMHSDFKSKKPKTELESLTGYVIREGKKYAIETPAYSTIYAALSNITDLTSSNK